MIIEVGFRVGEEQILAIFEEVLVACTTQRFLTQQAFSNYQPVERVDYQC